MAPQNQTRLFPQSDTGSTVPLLANYVELAALLAPRWNSDIAQKLRSASGFLPIPLTLGFKLYNAGYEIRPGDVLPDFRLGDIASDATREVRVAWMHSLYQYTLAAQPRDTTILHLNASFTSKMGWSHLVAFMAFILQFTLAVFASLANRREKDHLAGQSIRVLRGMAGSTQLTKYPPRPDVKIFRFTLGHDYLTSFMSRTAQ